MFSHIVTAAKGLFTRNESEDNIADPAGIAAATTPKMAPSVQRASATEAIPEISQSNAAMKKSKRKANSGNAEKLEDIQAKRRKRSTLEAADSDEDESTSSINTSDPHEIEESSTENVPKKHFRFGSEEPAAPAVAAVAQVQQRNQDEDEDSDDDDDDDAPETIDNSAQLIKMKEQAKKQEKAKQLEEQRKKEKRRKIDETRKLQAKSLPKSSKAIDVPSFKDDLSESTATLQESVQDAPRREIPALLPDDILNAQPMIRPPTPPAEDEFVAPAKPTKLRFLENTEKAPRDLRAGDLTIRVLDAPSSKQKSSKPALTPKASKSGRNVKNTWLSRQRSTGHANGMRRTAGGPSGFVRR